MTLPLASAPIAALRRHPTLADGLLAALLAALSVPGLWLQPADAHLHSPDAVGVLLVLGTCVPLTWRRRRPIEVLAATLALGIVLDALHYSSGGGNGVCACIALYTVGAFAGQRAARVALAATLTIVAATLLIENADYTVPDLVANVVVYVTAWLLGRNNAARREALEAAHARAERLERQRDDDARAAVIEERTRIARELHDVVAHHVSVMVVQAAAARRTLDRDPALARESLAVVEDTGRAALTEMRRLLGLLRGGAATTRTIPDPQPGVDALPELLDQVSAAGLAADLRLEGDPGNLAAGVQLTIFRIVQEALTNCLKHAGPASAHVCVRVLPEHVEVTVIDDGHGPVPLPRPAGHGLLGMHERVALHGGTLRTGPAPGGGFAVAVTLPCDAVPA